ncbi:hypothetical protein GDO86_005554 [Hymenochirus boettgeri]|uniref:Uncharacterized protein n=1 Tax=Hymenochirus boettgeri TaxID=247094 RepID=A0A8T2J7F5_9PIPI|nr:hypothetical protein GDO86_005554 [Hymenochirus boettgeri]
MGVAFRSGGEWRKMGDRNWKHLMVKYLTLKNYDCLPVGISERQVKKRIIMENLRRKIHSRYGVDIALKSMQRIWSDLKRRRPDYVRQIQATLDEESIYEEEDAAEELVVCAVKEEPTSEEEGEIAALSATELPMEYAESAIKVEGEKETAAYSAIELQMDYDELVVKKELERESASHSVTELQMEYEYVEPAVKTEGKTASHSAIEPPLEDAESTAKVGEETSTHLATDPPTKDSKSTAEQENPLRLQQLHQQLAHEPNVSLVDIHKEIVTMNLYLKKRLDRLEKKIDFILRKK